mgnify:CR=1 FL=1|tara:strand:+ start:58746 stop:59132 length:387 start_codon:yes stop_codon:yes gene_type:complete
MRSTKPYLVRAIFDWCIEEGFTPHILVYLSDKVIVPRGYDKHNEIVLNISPTSVTKLVISDLVTFSSRFAGIHEDIVIPIDSIKSIYAQENGEGIHFNIKNKIKHISKDKTQINSSKEKKNSHLKLVK